MFCSKKQKFKYLLKYFKRMVNKGYGVELNNVVLLGGVAVLGYMAYKVLNSGVAKGLGDTVGGVGNAVGGVGQGIGTIGTSTGQFYSDVASAGSAAVTGGLGLISNTERLAVAAENKAAAIISSITTGGKSVTPITPVSISKVDNESASASAAAYYSGGTYNANTGVLIVDNKGYSVMPSNVPSVISKLRTGIQPTTSKLKPSLT
jgi:hypothetical protein